MVDVTFCRSLPTEKRKRESVTRNLKTENRENNKIQSQKERAKSSHRPQVLPLFANLIVMVKNFKRNLVQSLQSLL